MKQFAIIGVSSFGLKMLDELSEFECEIMIIDKDRELIESLKDKCTAAYVADVINEEIIKRLIPESIDGVIIDLGDRIEVSILVANYLKKMGIRNIIAKAETDEHGEILSIVGANEVVFPNREAAKRITPALVSSLLFNYLPISNGLVIAEVKVPVQFYGMTLVDADMRRKSGLNVVAVKRGIQAEYEFFNPDRELMEGDFLLVAGNEMDVAKFSGNDEIQRRKGIGQVFRKLFERRS